MNPFFDCATPSLDTVSTFMQALEAVRRRLPREAWHDFARTDATVRRWRFFLAADPYTRWGLLKPRGYPGDATLMDFAYGHASVRDSIAAAGTAGGRIYDHTSMARQSQSARHRIALLGARLRALSADGSRACVASFASGHARELECLSAGERAAIEHFTAIDLDAASLDTARGCAEGMEFTPVRRNVIADGFDDLPQVDFAYSLGLFDYLNDARARAVLTKMWQRVAPGGTLLVANLAPDAGNLAYCEAIMDWWMIPRSALQMAQLGQGIGEGSTRTRTVTQQGCFHYLEISH